MRTKAASKLDPDVVRVAPLPGVTGDIPLPGRTFVRKNGCWNCVHFNQGELYRNHRKVRRHEDLKILVARLLDSGLSLDAASAAAERRVAAGDLYLEVKHYGLCLGGGGQADFQPATYICSRYTGRVRTEGPIDDLPEELKEQLGDPT